MITKSAYFYAILAVLLWSSVATAFKLTLEFLTPINMLLFASITSLVVLFFILFSQKKLKTLFELSKKEIAFSLLLGLLNPFLYYIVLFKAYSLLPAQEAQAINYSWALVLSYLSVAILGQKLRAVDILAGVICYFGVVIISTKGEFNFDFSSKDGVALALFSTLLWSIYWVYNTKLNLEPTVGLFLNFVGGVIAIVIYISILDIEVAVDFRGLLGSIYIGLFEMGVTFVLWLKALQLSNASSKVSNLIFLSPFLSLIFISTILKEKILLSTVIGLILIIAGLLLQRIKIKS